MAKKAAPKPTIGALDSEGTTLDDLLAKGVRFTSDPAPPPAKEEGNGIVRSAGDTALSLGQGLVGGVKSISDVAGADNAVSRSLGDVSEYMQAQYSKPKQAQMANRQAEIDAADESGSTGRQVMARMGALEDAPLDTLASGVGSLIPTMAATVATGGVGGIAIGAAQGAGGVKGGIYDSVRQGLIKQGATPEVADAKAAEAQAYSSENAKQIAIGAVLGGVDGRFGVEGAVNKLVRGGETGGGIVKRMAKGSGEEAIPEAAQGGQQQYAQNVALNNAGVPTDPMTGVLGEAASQGTVGGVLGGVINVPKPHPAQVVPDSGPMSRAVNAGAAAAQPMLALPAPEPTTVYPTRVPQEPQQQTPLLGAPPAQIPFNPTISDTLVADENGNVRPQTVQSEHANQARAAELESLGQGVPRGAEGDVPVEPGSTPQLPKLGYDDRPTNTMLVDDRGMARPQTHAEQVDIANANTPPYRDESLGRQAKPFTPVTPIEDANPNQGSSTPYQTSSQGLPGVASQGLPRLGLNPDAGSTIDVPSTVRRIGQRGEVDGPPLKNMTAARLIQKKQGGEIVKVDGGWMVNVPEATDATVVKEAGTEPQTAAPVAARDDSAAAGSTDVPATGSPAVEASGLKPAEPESPKSPSEAKRIEDFGETLTGARKHYAQAYADTMKEAGSLSIAEHPLSKTWPEPNYSKLTEGTTDSWVAAFVRAARDAVPSKPQTGWKLKSWADKVATLRGMADDAMSGKLDKSAVDSEMALRGPLRDLRNAVDLYQAVGHETSLKGITLQEGSYGIYGGQKFDPPKRMWVVNQKKAGSSWGTDLATGSTKEEAIANFKETLARKAASPAETKATKFEIYGRRSGGFLIGKKIGGDVVEIHDGFKDAKAARAYLAEHQSELEAKLDAMKNVPEERNATNAPRLGDDFRHGSDVTPAQFGESFGFRGVQFGNYVEGARRQKDLNDAYDALMDLASVLDIPTKSLSLNGELGLAFGARGKGGKRPASAHYEPGGVVINLTKGSGAGSLAHEWWHALDNYFSRQDGNKSGFMSDDKLRGKPGAVVRPEMRKAFEQVQKAISDTKIRQRSTELDRMRSKAYWGTGLEMSARSFESYVINKLADQSKANDYLANIVSETAYSRENAYPYPTAGEIPTIRSAFDNFFQTVETKETDSGTALFQRGERKPSAPASAARVRRVQEEVRAHTRRWANAPEVEVIASMDDAPEEVRKQVKDSQEQKGATGAPRGFLHKGKVYIVASEMHGEMDTMNTLAHEVLGHAGLRGLFGDKLNGVLDRMAEARRDDIAAKAKQYGLDTSIESQRRLAAEEVLAEMAETEPKNTFVQNAIAAIRSWMRANIPGFGKMRMSDAEIIRSWLAPARGHIENGKPAPKADQGDEALLQRTKAAPTPAEKQDKTIPEWAKANPALRAAATKIDTYAPKKTIKEKVDALKTNWKDKLVAGVVDAYAPLKKLSMDAYISARMTKAAPGAFEGMLLYGKPVMGDDGGLSGDLDGKGFIGAMQDLKGEHDRFFMWMAGNRADKLAGEGRENLFKADEITAMKGLNQGRMDDGANRIDAYRKAAQTLHAYNKSVMDIAEKTGLIDGEARHLWEHEFYVPFYRMMDESTTNGPSLIKGLTRQKAFDKLKGGTENLGDLMENTLSNWSHMLSASLANHAAGKALTQAENLSAAIEAKEEAAKQMAKDAGIKGHATYFMDKGQQRWFTVEDPLLLAAISSMQPVGLNGLPMKVMGAFKKYLTLGTTIAPAFKLRNLIRDTIAAPATNEMSYNVFKNLTDGWKLTHKDDAGYAQMLFGGALMRFGTQEGDRAAHTKRLIDAGVDKASILDTAGKVKAFFANTFEHYQEFGDRLENVNRAALYQQLMAGGMSAKDAAFNARDMMDFGMSGAWPAVRMLTQVVPFMNARIQGLAKLAKGAHDNPKRFATVTGAVALASMALLLAYHDDKDWKAREDWDRDAYWWFKVGDKAFRIPKPFEVGALGTIAERSLELMTEDEMTGKRFGKRLQQMLTDTFMMNPTPQLFKPMLDIYANKDSFTGRDIETQGMERLSKPERAGPGTSGVAKVLGAAGNYTNLSPVQIDQMIRGYLGWMGATAASTADIMASPLSDKVKPAHTSDEFLGGFVKSLPSNQSRYVTELYDQSKAIAEVMADIRQARETGNVDKADALLADHPGIQAENKQLTSATTQLSKIGKQIRAIQNGDGTAQDKRDRIDALNQQRNAVAERIRTKETSRSPALQ